MAGINFTYEREYQPKLTFKNNYSIGNTDYCIGCKEGVNSTNSTKNNILTVHESWTQQINEQKPNQWAT